jgi:4-diphosphocytidyl-2-C-methyl-D-erythritol kinase
VRNSARPRVEIEAPAKLNLGLEVIGRREDGYHDLATLFVAIDLADRLILSADEDLTLCVDDPHLAGGENLVLRALRSLRESTGHPGGASVRLHKRIPVAAGLGGGSSDAAATLLAARDLWNLDLPPASLASIASGIGSDVPFFLRGGCALGRGRGDLLEQMPLPERIWFVVVTPTVSIPHKTASLYDLLRPGDFSDGSRVMAQASLLRAGRPRNRELLGNAFARPLTALCPELAPLPDIMREAGAPVVAISGAGPTHYTVVDSAEDAERIAEHLRASLLGRAGVFVAAPVPARSWAPGPGLARGWGTHSSSMRGR